jgi:hypothetical protein
MRSKTMVLAILVNSILAVQAADAPKWQLAQFFGGRCLTPQLWCIMAVPAPVGSSCFCTTPYGPVPGVVVQ